MTGRDRRTGREAPKVVWVNRFFHPDISATSQMLSDVVLDATGRPGRYVVVTSRARYDDPKARLPARETVGGVEVWRTWTLGAGTTSLARRALAFLGFYAAASVRLAMLLRPGDVVVVKTDPPLFSVLAGAIARARGAVQVNWLQDLYPEVARELGVAAARGPLGRALARARDATLRRAAMNVVIGERMRERLAALGVTKQRIALIPNWADHHAVAPLRGPNELRAAWGLQDKLVVGYSGNFGRAHDFDTILSVADRYRDREDLCFLFVGGGDLRVRLEAAARDRGLRNIQWRPYQPRAALSRSLGVPDIHWLSLSPALEGLIVPSKLYGIMAAGKPFIFVGDADGEVARVARERSCGVQVDPGDVDAFAAAIERYRAAPDLREAQGSNGRNALEMLYSKERALGSWRSLLRRLLAGG